MKEDADVVEVAELVWPPEATGIDDQAAIDTIESLAGPDSDQGVWDRLVEICQTYPLWTEENMETIQTHLRMLFRGMEYVGLWQGENTLREELTRVHGDIEHLTDLRREKLVHFARNMVMKGTVALTEAGAIAIIEDIEDTTEEDE
jgi:hypothetical protein